MKTARSLLLLPVVLLVVCDMVASIDVGTPEEVNMNGERLAAIQTSLAKLVDEKIIPGAAFQVCFIYCMSRKGTERL